MKKIVSLILVIAIMLLVGCEDASQADTQYKYIQDRNSKCCIYVDEETGVNYIKYIDVYGGGITVRLNADGTPYVSEVE